jgi:monoamine oxidase
MLLAMGTNSKLNGAVESGQRAASEVLAALKK